MAEVIPRDIAIDEAIVAASLFSEFKLDAKAISLLGEGFDNVVYLVNNNWVFRFPRRAEAALPIEREILFLNALKGQLPVEIPTPTFISAGTALFPRPFYGHQLIHGKCGGEILFNSKEYQRLAQDLGHFLRTLHGINFAAIGLRDIAYEPVFDRTLITTMTENLLTRLNVVRQHYPLDSHLKKFEQIMDDASNYVTSGPPKLIHNDLYHRHIILDERHRLKGIIDWGDTGIGDPSSDFGIVFQFLPKNTHEIFLKSYGDIDPNALLYARFLGLYYAVALLWFGHDRGDQDLIRTSMWTFEHI